MENQNNDNQLKIELSPEVAEGTYANLAIITRMKSSTTSALECVMMARLA